MSLLNGKRVFITGATGFVGSHLVRRSLKKGAEVFINIRNTSDTWRIRDILKDVSIIDVDITEFDKLHSSIKKIRPDILFHTAVYGGNATQKEFEKIINVNILGTSNLLRSCKDINIGLFVNTGSSSEYGVKNYPMKEDDFLNPVTDYGISKAAATLFCQKSAITEKLPTLTLRLFSPYGPYEQKSRLIPSVILETLQKKNPQIVSGDFVRDFIYIDDVIDAYEVATGLKDPCGQIYNIGSGEQHTVGFVTETIINLLGNEVTSTSGLSPRWECEPSFWQADISRAESELNWTPKHKLKDGIEKTICWFKDNIKLYP